MATRPISRRLFDGRRLIAERRLVAVSAFMVACGSSDPAPPGGPASAPPRVLVGAVSGTDARVGVVATSVRARFYFCGGPSSYLTLTGWIPVELVDPSHVATHAGDFDLDATLSGANAKGTLREADGTLHVFDATEVAPGTTIAGLYDAASPCGKVGLIVSQASASTPPTGQGACISGDSQAPSIRQVNPILPLTRDASGAIRITVDGSGEQALVHAAVP